MMEQYLWVEKYRPHKIDDCILPKDLKSAFRAFVAGGNVPNLLLVGGAGIGKTTVAKAMLDQLQSDYIVINGSLDRNIDTLRNDMKRYASSVSLTSDSRKYIILDEADYLNPQSTQPALRNFIEEYAVNCGFILTANYKAKIIEPLHSRCSVVEFSIPKSETAQLATEFYKRVQGILEAEGVTYDKKVLVTLIQKWFPDFRRVLNELQRYASVGQIDSGILTNFEEMSAKAVYMLMKQKDFTSVRKWVGENASRDAQDVYTTLYDLADQYVEAASIPALVLILADYQYQDSFAANKTIHLTACLTKMMMELRFR